MIACLLQVDYIVQMEDSKTLRRCGKLTRFVCSEDARRNWFSAMIDKLQGVDYNTQEKLVEKLHEDMLDLEGEHKVYIMCIFTLVMHNFKSATS